MTSETIKTIIADDEPKARNNLQRLLSSHPEFEVIQSCSDGKETLQVIREQNPDLVFLDIQMPELSGFELLNELDEDQLPRIVFVTAYDEFALKAFEVHAIDYLMKPFDSARFEKTLGRIKKSLHTSSQKEIDLSLKKLVTTLHNESCNPGKILIKQDRKIFFLDTSDITRIESAGNYVKIRTNSDSYLARDTMKHMEKKLDKNIFFRVHRMMIVNIAHVKVIEPWFHGDYQITMKDGSVVTMSRNYKQLLDAFS